MNRVGRNKIVLLLLSAPVVAATAWLARALYLCYLWNVVWDLRYDDTSRQWAMDRIVNVQPVDVTVQLESLIESGTEGQVYHAFEAVMKIGEHEGRPVLANLVKSGNRRSRREVAKAIGGSEKPADLALLRTLMKDEDQIVQLEAHFGALRSGDVSVVPWLITALRSGPEGGVEGLVHWYLSKAFCRFEDASELMGQTPDEIFKNWADWWNLHQEGAAVCPAFRQANHSPWPEDILRVTVK